MSESSCAHCANEIPPEARICANCGMPVSEVTLPQEEQEALPREALVGTQTTAPSPPVEQPISFSPPTRQARQNRVRRGWPTYLTLRGLAKRSRPDWLPSWLTPRVAVIAGLVITLALLFVDGSVRAGLSESLNLTKTPQGESKEALPDPEDAPTAAPSDDPTAPPSPSTSPSPSGFLSSFLSPSPWVSKLLSPLVSDGQKRPQTASPASPSSTGGEARACQQQIDADDFAQALDFTDAGSLAEYLDLKGGKDKLTQVLRECNDLEDLASSLGFSSSERFAQYLGLDDKRKLARSLQVSGELAKLAESVGLASSE